MHYDDDVSREAQLLLCDAQTSGGLLAALPAAAAAEAIGQLRERGITDAAVIGRIEASPEGRMVVSRSASGRAV